MADPWPIERVFEDAFKSLRLGRLHRRLRLFGEWPRIVGDSNARMCRPCSLRAGTLIVECEDSTWADKLKYMEEPFMERISEMLGPGVVRRIRFVVGTRRAPRRPAIARVPLSADDQARLDRALDRPGLADKPELREELRSLYEHLVARRRRTARR
ncbi:MAG: DUF721 domain-containing protein [Deltaproteobacteria bacterium]|nr:DUF721 domain-containing protein [Deltaproteobacteria bacterium]